MAVITTLSLTQPVKQFFDRQLLDRLKAKLWHAQFADKRPLPRNSGKSIEFTTYDNLAVATTPLTEGVRQTTGDAQALVSSVVTGTVQEFGAHIEYSDLFETAKIDPALREQVDILGYQAGLSIDTIVRDAIRAGGTAQFVNDRANRDALVVGDLFSTDEVRINVTRLRKQDVMPLMGSDYMFIVHPVNVSDLQSDLAGTGWLEAHKYDQPNNIFTGEIGKLYGARFVETSNVFNVQNAGSVETYDTILLGKHGYAMTELAGKGMKLLITAPTASSHDPLAQAGTVGWRATFATVVLNSERIIVLGAASVEGP